MAASSDMSSTHTTPSYDMDRMQFPTVIRPVKKKTDQRYLMLWVPVRAVDHLKIDEKTDMMCYVDDTNNLVYHPINATEKKLSIPLSNVETGDPSQDMKKESIPTKLKPIAFSE